MRMRVRVGRSDTCGQEVGVLRVTSFLAMVGPGLRLITQTPDGFLRRGMSSCYSGADDP